MKKLTLAASTVALACTLVLSGCATTTAPVGVTASTKSSVTVPTKSAFELWATACSSFATAEYGGLVAIAAGKIKPSAFPTIKAIQATITPLCQVYPADPAIATSTIDTALLSLSKVLQENAVPAAPTISGGK